MITSADIVKINKAEKLTMKQLLELKQRLVCDMNTVGSLLDRLIIDHWGFHYSETNDDLMIDSLDYGTQGVSFNLFCKTMNNYTEETTNDN